jgi:hypothetical protein
MRVHDQMVYTRGHWVWKAFKSLLHIIRQYGTYALTARKNEAEFLYALACEVVEDYDRLHNIITFEDLVDFLGFVLRDEFAPVLGLRPHLYQYILR